MDRINTSSKKYVVFDVETNGLRSKYDDLLSISFYKPDDGKTYNKFLPYAETMTSDEFDEVFEKRLNKFIENERSGQSM